MEALFPSNDALQVLGSSLAWLVKFLGGALDKWGLNLFIGTLESIWNLGWFLINQEWSRSSYTSLCTRRLWKTLEHLTLFQWSPSQV